MPQIIPIKFSALIPDTQVTMKVRPIPDSVIRDHGTLCRAFGLDPVRTRFELPRTWGGPVVPGRSQDALVFFSTDTGETPIGKLVRMSENEKIRDDNPTDPRDFYNLNNRI